MLLVWKVWGLLIFIDKKGMGEVDVKLPLLFLVNPKYLSVLILPLLSTKQTDKKLTNTCTQLTSHKRNTKIVLQQQCTSSQKVVFFSDLRLSSCVDMVRSPAHTQIYM